MQDQQHDDVHDDQQAGRDLLQELADRVAAALHLGGERAHQAVVALADRERQVAVDDRLESLGAQTHARPLLYPRHVRDVAEVDELAQQDGHEGQDQKVEEGHGQAERVEGSVEERSKEAAAGPGRAVLDVLQHRRQHARRERLEARQDDGEGHQQGDLVAAHGKHAEQLSAGQQPAAVAWFGHRTPRWKRTVTRLRSAAAAQFRAAAALLVPQICVFAH